MRGCSASLTKVMDFDGTVVLGQPVETREANIRCLIPSLPQAATIIQSLAGLAAKLAVVAAAGAGLYVAYQYTDVKGVSNWTTSAASSDSKAIGNEPARASSSQQRLMAEPGSCGSQTWPNISPECITGQAEPAKVAERPTIVPEQPSSTLLPPTKLLGAVSDPEVTASLPASAGLAVRQPERLVVGKAKKRNPEEQARAERKILREAGRRRRPSPMIAAAERAAAKPAARASEPIQFRLAEGNR